jgi:hypothetical protein
MTKGKLSSLLIVLFFTLCQNSFSKSGSDHVGNGGGFAESSLNFAFSNFNALAERLRLESDINQSLLVKILESAAVEARAPQNLKILREGEGVAFQNQAFLTEATPNTPIYVNLEALYPVDPEGLRRPLLLPQCVRFVAQILAAKLGLSQNLEFQTLALQIENNLKKRTQNLHFNFPGSVPLMRPIFSTISNPKLGTTESVYLTDFHRVYDLTQLITNGVPCSGKTEAFGLGAAKWVLDFGVQENTWAVEFDLMWKCLGQEWSNTETFLILVPMKIEPTNERFAVVKEPGPSFKRKE